MSAVRQHDDRSRRRMLAAMGVGVYQLRERFAPASAAAAPAVAVETVANPGGGPRAVVVGDAAARGQLDRVLRALGLAADDVVYVEAGADGLSEAPPHATAYLVLGERHARVLGAELPTQVQQAAQIVVVAAPATWRGNALAKRQAWQALKVLRRTVGAGA